MNLSIDKDPKDPAPFFFKASTLNYMQKYDEAVQSFQSAISLKSDDADFYSGLGDAYYHLGKLDLALEVYKQKATEQKHCRTDRTRLLLKYILTRIITTKR